MALSVDATTNLHELFDAESATGWTTDDAVLAVTGFQREGTNCLGMQGSAETVYAYKTISSVNLTNQRVYIWMFLSGRPETKANGGFRIIIGDTSNARAYYVGGSDDYGFQFGAWSCFMLDCANLPGSGKYENIIGSGAPTLSAVTVVGVQFNVANKAVGTTDNCFWDIGRYGTGIIVTGGGVGTEGDFDEIVADDESTADGKAYGMIRRLQAGVYGIQGDIIFGDASGTDNVYFEDSNRVVVLEDHVHESGTPTPFNIKVVGNGTGTTSVVLGVATGSGDTERGRNGVNFRNANTANTLNLDCSDTDNDAVEFYGCNFVGVNGTVIFSDDATAGPNHRLSGCVFSACGQADPNRVRVRNCTFSGYTSDSNAALLWNSNINIKNCLFVACSDATNDPHAIEHPDAGTFDYDGLIFSDNDYDINFSAASGTLTINKLNGSNPTTYEITGGGSSVTIQSTVVITITVQDKNTNPISGVQTGIYKLSDRTEIMNEDTIGDGTATENYVGATPIGVCIWCRKASFGDTKYKNFSTLGTLSGSTFDLLVTLEEDPNNNATS